MQKPKLLLVEDEKNFGVVMRDYLLLNQFEVCWCENGLLGLSKFETERFDLCIVDVMMPQMDGFTFVETIKQLKPDIPVIFLTARSMREDQLRGYKAGADDYVIKPFDTEILIHKITAILKRHLGSQTEPVNKQMTFAGFIYRVDRRELSHQSGVEAKLSPKESALLVELATQPNKVISKSLLLQKIWREETYFTGRSMDVYITKLRKHLDADKRIQIENIHGNGYCLKILD
jgi:two-component system, OmpR family, response regulator